MILDVVLQRLTLTRALQTKEFYHFINSCIDEGWSDNLTHLECLYKSYKDDFLVVLHEDVIAGFVIALRESDNFGFISNLLIIKSFRSQGFGKQLLNFALQHLNNRQISLDCENSKKNFYEKVGFKAYFKTSMYLFASSLFSIENQNITVSNVSLDDILNYNKKAKVLKNTDYTSCLYNSKNTTYKAIYKTQNISSYAIKLKHKDGYLLIISSGDIDEALVLFFNLCQDLKKHTNIYFEVSDIDPINLSISKQLKMKKLSSTTKMYNKILN